MTSRTMNQRLKTGCAILVAMHVLTLIFWCTGSITTSVLGESISIDYEEAFELSEIGFMYYLQIFMTLLGLVGAALPILSGTKGKVGLTLSLVIDIITFLACTLLVMVVMTEAKEEAYGLVTFSPSFVSILHFLMGLAMIIYHFFVRKTMRSAVAAERSGIYSAPAPYAPPAAPSAPAETGARFCTGCGSPLTPGSNFCGVCGKKN